MDPATRQAIDSLIAEISHSCDRLEDCLQEDREAHHRDSEESRKKRSDSDDPELDIYLSRRTRIRGTSGGSGGSLFNCFPSSHRGACHDVNFILLPRHPKAGPMGPEDAKEFAEEYFSAALASLIHWAEVCKGKSVVILTDTWPLPGEVNSSLFHPARWDDEFVWRWRHHLSRAMRRFRSNGKLHRIMGQILEHYHITCEVHLFTSRGNVTQLPDPSPRNWPPGW